MTGKKWFKAGVEKRQPNTLNWHKDMPRERRLNRAYASCPKNWTHAHKLRRVISALVAIHNVTRDRETKIKTKSDQVHVSWMLKKYKEKHPNE